jgi:cytochrome c oxidase cbb3-type subunit 1
MSVISSPSLKQALDPSAVEQTERGRAQLVEIDASCRWPVLFLFGCALWWLLAGSLLALAASWKMHWPELMANSSWLTFGRIRPAHLNTVVYGFASQAAIGLSIWLMCRLCRVRLIQGGLVVLATLFWNLGLKIGVVGILIGDSTGIEWLEMPIYASPILFAAYGLIAIWAIITFRYRREKTLYVSQWYLLAALFWFPWLYSAANILLVIEPVRGTVQAAVNWWFAHNVLGLWFTPIGLGAIYYFIPKVIGRPIHSYYLSSIGFWSLALFYNWAGIHHLIGGPMPAWLISISVVASVMMVIPVVIVAINHHLTMRGSFHLLKTSPTLRFMVFGAMCYTLVSLQGSSMAVRALNRITHFTHYTVGHSHLGLYAFFSMVAFGAMYFIVPRLTLREWPSSKLISLHFWTTAIGITVYFVALTVGGIQQGMNLHNPDMPFLKVVEHTKPFLVVRTYAGVLMTVGHFAFAVHFLRVLLLQWSSYRAPLPFIDATRQSPAVAGK